jgi:hypothetical protein
MRTIVQLTVSVQGGASIADAAKHVQDVIEGAQGKRISVLSLDKVKAEK